MKKLILASGSPRRADLLRQIGIRFEAKAALIKEPSPGLQRIKPSTWAVKLALEKAKAVQAQFPHDYILGADTVVVLEKKIIGKPLHRKNAVEMLTQLSGKTHRVITGFALIYRKKTWTGFSETKVTFRKFSRRFILDYVKTGEPMDKAGAYGIQGLGALCVEKIEGDYFNVVGLPLLQVWKLLLQIGFLRQGAA